MDEPANETCLRGGGAQPVSDVDDLIDYYERQIKRFLDGGPDPRGPDRTTPFESVSWPTRPLWVMGRYLHRLANYTELLGMTEHTARARQIVSDLQGRCQSPEELAEAITFMEARPHPLDR